MWRILYVEDDADSLELLSYLLGNSGRPYQLTAAPNAKEAIKLISDQPFDLYILDQWMYEMDGAELCKWIRMTGSNSPIVFFSGAVREVDKARAFRAGANEYLEKPEDLFRVESVIEELLAGPKHLPAAVA